VTMHSFRSLVTVATVFKAINGLHVPNAGYLNIAPRYDHTVDPSVPDWNNANETTADATANGSAGAIIEPDLVEGATGKDGATVKKIKFGPYTIQPRQKKEFSIGAFGLSPIEIGREPPCRDCYITAMQLNLEYADGKHANVDTGAW
jgi:hypothetical protein